MKIEKMTLDDVSAVLRLGAGVEAFQVADHDCFWSQAQLEAWVEADEDVLLVAREGTEVIGFTLSTLHKPTGKVTWENLYVLPNFRCKGVGQRLIKELLFQLKSRSASYLCGYVRTENRAEVSYFEQQGFDMGYNFTWLSKYL